MMVIYPHSKPLPLPSFCTLSCHTHTSVCLLHLHADSSVKDGDPVLHLLVPTGSQRIEDGVIPCQQVKSKCLVACVLLQVNKFK